uniref:Uncharacterized protein n=1 Tax=Zea mays TaxID=4577 RepID=C4J8E0_MAIZE|nr:unknown [Zea mays]
METEQPIQYRNMKAELNTSTQQTRFLYLLGISLRARSWMDVDGIIHRLKKPRSPRAGRLICRGELSSLSAAASAPAPAPPSTTRSPKMCTVLGLGPREMTHV